MVKDTYFSESHHELNFICDKVEITPNRGIGKSHRDTCDLAPCRIAQSNEATSYEPMLKGDQSLLRERGIQQLVPRHLIGAPLSRINLFSTSINSYDLFLGMGRVMLLEGQADDELESI